jgi:hypothetical protein
MVPSRDHLGRLIRAVRRRWALVRLIEGAGLGLLTGSALGLVLVPLLLWRGTPALAFAAGLMLLGMAVGAMAGWMRRPTLVQAATEADRQLGTHDLLTTGLLIDATCGDQPWRSAVLAMAQQRSHALAPRSVLLHRLGGRAWGGIGLSAALVLTLGLMSSSSQPTLARAPADEFASGVATDGPGTTPADGGAAMLGRVAVPDVATGRPRPDMSARPSAAEPADRAGNASSSRTLGQAGQGAGDAQTADAARPADPLAVAASRAEGSAEGDAGGAGGVSSGPLHARGEVAGTAAPAEPSPTPPWLSPTWASDRAEAARALDRRTVPDSCRDVIREYFSDQPPAVP